MRKKKERNRKSRKKPLGKNLRRGRRVFLPTKVIQKEEKFENKIEKNTSI